jgi:hypothetical protein
MTKYQNRYNDEYEFSLLPNGNILWTGKFQWCRSSWPNVYDKAYAKYQEDGGTASLVEFTKLVHEWDDENSTYTETAKKYGQYVYSDKDTIDMVDPSGGPYIARGNNMEYFDKEFAGKIVHSFRRLEEGYEIVCYGTTE